MIALLSGGLAFHTLAGKADGGGVAGQLALALRQKIEAAAVDDDLVKQITPAASPRTTAVGFDERRSTVRHP